MTAVNVHKAKTQLSRLILRAENGEEIVLARDGKPVAKIVGLHPPSTKRQLGLDRGAFVVPDDFDSLPDDLLTDFEGR